MTIWQEIPIYFWWECSWDRISHAQRLVER